jgi:alpha-beta hydrolase superfamily lysophospholipase
VITLVVLGMLLVPFLVIGGVLGFLWRDRRRGVLRWSLRLYGAVVLLVIVGIGPYLMAWALVHAGTRGPDRRLRTNPGELGLPYEDIVFESADGLRLRGWFVPPSRYNVVLVCTHGLFRNRREMLERAAAACKAGYGALLYDSRSHGESDKGIVSLGHFEKNDVLGAVQYIQRRYQDSPEAPRVVLMGISAGAVATLGAAAESRRYDAIVVDSPFANVRETVTDHAWLFLRMPRFPFPPLFIFWFERLAEFNVDRVDTREALERIKPVPLLIIASEGDRRIPPSVARDLHARARSPVKKLAMFPADAGHGAAARVHPARYAEILVGFLGSAFPVGAAEQPPGGPVSTSSAAADSPR